jgi:hypothetical protein
MEDLRDTFAWLLEYRFGKRRGCDAVPVSFTVPHSLPFTL